MKSLLDFGDLDLIFKVAIPIKSVKFGLFNNLSSELVTGF